MASIFQFENSLREAKYSLTSLLSCSVTTNALVHHHPKLLPPYNLPISTLRA